MIAAENCQFLSVLVDYTAFQVDRFAEFVQCFECYPIFETIYQVSAFRHKLQHKFLGHYGHRTGDRFRSAILLNTYI